MLTLVRKARSRWLRNELVSQGASATSAALVAVILLLLLGTQILDWRWAAVIPVAAIAIGIYLVRRRMPSLYVVAQVVDRRLGFADEISTALFFSGNPSRCGSPEICALQLERANRLAESADLRQAVPYTLPRSVYPLVALALVASSLFALRYGLTRRLDLKPPIASILRDTLGFESHPETARNNRKPLSPQRSDPQDDSLTAPEPQDSKGNDSPSDPEDSPQAAGQQQPGKDEQKASENGKSQPGEDADKAEGEEKDQSGDDRSSGDQANGSQQSKGDSKQDSNGKQDSNSSSDNSSLLSKMKDALQNMLSKVKPQQGNGSQQPSQNQSGNQPSKSQDGKQQASKDGQKSPGQQGDSQEGEAGDQSQESQDPQSKGSGKSDAQQASKQPGSGIGSQDGDKSIKQAEQLAAMGKISEILGKRSATITGEATVEVQATSQQLRTPYAQRGSEHSQGGAEINRDEVPVALQTFVERYFDQVRKQPPPPAASPAKKD